MEEWQKLEKHHRDYLDIMKKHGLSLRKFDGRLFWPEFKERGHTSLAFTCCACRTRG